MAINAGGIASSLSVNLTQFRQGLNQAVREARATSRVLRRVFDRVDRRAALASRGVSSLGSNFKDLTRIVSGIVIAQTFYQGIRAISSAKDAVIEFTTAMERAQVSLTYMLESSVEATSFINTMKDFAAVTDYSTGQVIEMSRRLQAMGFEAEVTKSVLQTVTDQVSLLGGGFDKVDRIVYALGQIRNSAKLAKTEVRQLINATIPVQDYLKEAFDLTDDQLQNIGDLAISGQDAVLAILYGMEKAAGGMSEVLANTVTGMIGTIRDDFLLISNEIIQPIYNVFKYYLTSVRDTMEELRQILRDKGLGGLLLAVIPPEFVKDVKVIILSVIRFAKVLGNLYDAAKPIVGLLGGTFIKVLSAVLPVILQLSLQISRLAKNLIVNVPAIRYLVTALAGLLIVNLVTKGFVALYGVLRLGSLFIFMSQAVTKLAYAIRVLYIAITAHPIAAIVTAIAGALIYFAFQAGKLDGIVDGLAAKFKALFDIDVSGFLAINEKVAEAVGKYDKHWSEIIGKTKAVGDAAEDSKKKVNDFLAAFDEVFTIPEPLDDAAVSLGNFDIGGLLKDLDDLFKVEDVFKDFKDLFSDLEELDIYKALGLALAVASLRKVLGLLRLLAKELPNIFKKLNQELTKAFRNMRRSLARLFTRLGKGLRSASRYFTEFARNFAKALKDAFDKFDDPDINMGVKAEGLSTLEAIIFLLGKIPPFVVIPVNVVTSGALASLQQVKEIIDSIPIAIAISITVTTGTLVAATKIIGEFIATIPNSIPIAVNVLTAVSLIKIAELNTALNGIPTVIGISITVATGALLQATKSIGELIAAVPKGVSIAINVLTATGLARVAELGKAIADLPAVKSIFVEVVLPTVGGMLKIFTSFGDTVLEFLTILFTEQIPARFAEFVEFWTIMFTTTIPKQFNEFIDWLSNNWQEVLLGTLLGIVAGVIIAFGGAIIAGIVAIGAQIGTALSGAFASVSAFFSGAGLTATTGAISTWASATLAAASLFFAGFLDDIIEWGDDLLTDIGDIFELMGTIIGDAIDDVGETLSGWGENISEFFSDLWGTANKDTEEGLNLVNEKVDEQTEDTLETLGRWGKDIGSYFDTTWDNLYTVVSDSFSSVGSTLDEKTESVGKQLEDWGKSISKFFTEVWKSIKKGVVESFSSIGNGISTGLSTAMKSIKSVLNSIIDLINKAIDKINTFSFSVDSDVPLIGGIKAGVKIPKIPRLATGGVVSRDGLYNLSEGNKKEAVIPLERSDVINMFAKAIASEMPKPVNGQITPTQITFEIGTLIGDDRSLTELERRLGDVRSRERSRLGGTTYV